MVFTAIVYVLGSGCAWRWLPPTFGVKVPTAHRWFVRWTEAGLWEEIRCTADGLRDRELIGWTHAVVDAAVERAETGRGSPEPTQTTGNGTNRTKSC